MAALPPDADGPVTALLKRARSGDGHAGDELVALVYDELRRLAGHLLRNEEPGHTLQPTALVHEAWLRLGGASGAADDRAHFFALAARAMRQVLVDHARRRRAAKRGEGATPAPLSDALPVATDPDAELLALDDAIERLGAAQPRLRQVVECRYFAGFTEDETALALGVTVRTIQRDWARARAWLYDALGGPA